MLQRYTRPFCFLALVAGIAVFAAATGCGDSVLDPAVLERFRLYAGRSPFSAGLLLLFGLPAGMVFFLLPQSTAAAFSSSYFGLFAGTILDNIRYGRPDATEDEIIEAAKRAEIYDDIMNMPDGFQTYVGERGVMLSGGQKQRVSIARIFLKNPPILILDEATSALDSVTEARIQGAFDELAKGRTTLIIAHRLSTIRNAHRIIVVDDNRIVEEGTHAQLLASGGEYAQLYNTQKSVSV